MVSTPNNPKLKNDFVHFLYGILLLEFPHEVLRPLFETITATLRPFRSPQELATHLHNRRKELYHSDIATIYRIIYQFFLDNGIDPKAIIHTHMHRGKGTSVRPENLICSVKSLLEPLITGSLDIREAFIVHIDKISKVMRPGTVQRVVKSWRDDGFSYGIISYGFPDGTIYKKSSVDGDSFILATHQLAPLRFNMPPFEKAWMVAETQKPWERLSNNETWEIVDNRFSINGTIHGEVLTFFDYLERMEIDRVSIDTPVENFNVTVITKEYTCPKYKRITLHTNCAYGAPVYMYGIGYEQSKPNTNQSIDDILTEIDEGVTGFFV